MDQPKQECGVKPALASKTIHFNWISGGVGYWLFQHLLSCRVQSYAFIVLIFWFTIGNIVLRFMTQGAISLLRTKSGELNEKPPKP